MHTDNAKEGKPEELYSGCPKLGRAGECLHFEILAVPGTESTKTCDTVKEAIKQKRKFLAREMAKKVPSVNIFVLNENIRNLEWLQLTWESMHYNPRIKWDKAKIYDTDSNVYMVLKKRCFTHEKWKNTDYSLVSKEDFPPLTDSEDAVGNLPGAATESRLYSQVASTKIKQQQGDYLWPIIRDIIQTQHKYAKKIEKLEEFEGAMTHFFVQNSGVNAAELIKRLLDRNSKLPLNYDILLKTVHSHFKDSEALHDRPGDLTPFLQFLFDDDD